MLALFFGDGNSERNSDHESSPRAGSLGLDGGSLFEDLSVDSNDVNRRPVKVVYIRPLIFKRFIF